MLGHACAIVASFKVSVMRVVMLESNSESSKFVHRTLFDAGYVCHTFSSHDTLLRQLRRETFDLMIVDWDGPILAGNNVLTRTRESVPDALPVVFAVSEAEEADITEMLNLGADDCIVKPISAAFLLARIRSLLRRAYSCDTKSACRVFGEFEFNLGTKQASHKGNNAELTQKEFDLALLLFQNLGRPMSRAHILDMIWNRDMDILSRSMDTHVSVLRSKLKLRPENGYKLLPVYGYGYRLERVETGTAPEAQ